MNKPKTINIASHQDQQSREMHEFVCEHGISTIFERFEAQQPQCQYCKQGLSCQLCSDGPCRISPKAPLGVCGVSGDVIVARNLLQLATIGTAANNYQLRNLAKTLKSIGEGRSSVKIKDEEKLRRMCMALGYDHEKPINELAVFFANFMLTEIGKQDDSPLVLMDLFAVEQRKVIWKKRDLYSSGPSSEILTALTKCMTNISNDPIDLMNACLRLGLANEYAGLWGITVIQDILIGTADLSEGYTNIACIDPDTVNIVANGHQPLFAAIIMDMANSDTFQTAARDAGAKGIKLYGSLCAGQQLFNVAEREEYKNIFGGQLGNWIQEELFIATGAVDLFLMDFNCSVPTLKDYSEKFGTKLLSIDPSVRFPDVESMDFDPEQAETQAKKVLMDATEQFRARKSDTSRVITIPARQTSSKAIAGYTTETVLKMFGNDINTYIKHMKEGSIVGAVAVAGCTTVRGGQAGKAIEELTLQLIRRSIMVIGAGCCSSTHQNLGMSTKEMAKLAGPKLKAICEKYDVPPIVSYGSCTDVGKILDTVAALAWTIGCDVSELPVAAAVPEYMEQKAIADIFTALAFGLLTYVSPDPLIRGSAIVTDYLTEGMVDITGGRMLLEEDPVKAADVIEAHIINRRQVINFD